MKRRRNAKRSKRLPSSLYVKLVAVFSAIIILMTVGIGLVVSRITRDYFTDAKLNDMVSAADGISYLMVKYIKSGDFSKMLSGEIAPDSEYYSLQSRMATAYEILGTDIFITDRQGTIMMSFPLLPNADDDISVNTVFFPRGYESKFMYVDGRYRFPEPDMYTPAFRDDEPHVDYGRFYKFYNDKDGDHLTVCKRIVSYQASNAEVYGTVIMSYPMPQLAAAQNTITSSFVIATVVAVVIAMLALIFVTRIITRPLKRLQEGAHELAEGNFKIQIEKTTNDEVGDLVDSFNMAAQSLDNLDTVRNDFIANVSHELRTPMTSIRGFVEAIMDGVIPPEREHEYLAKVRREVLRLSDLVNDLLDWARLSAGQGNLKLTNFDINSLIINVISNLEPQLSAKQINIYTGFYNQEEVVYADAASIERVLINLINNAIKFTPDGGTIVVETYPEGDRVRINVRDSGVGMSPEDAALVFERFYKVDKSRSSDRKSTGLGLSIVQKILQNHNQSISVESELGKGSCFSFTLEGERK